MKLVIRALSVLLALYPATVLATVYEFDSDGTVEVFEATDLFCFYKTSEIQVKRLIDGIWGKFFQEI